MRVDPNYLSGVASALDQTTVTEANLTQQITTGSSVNQLSDNPAAAGQDVLLTAAINTDTVFQKTASSTVSMLQVSDSALASVVSQLTTALSLATEGNNGTLNANNRQSIATQLTGIRDEVLSLANTTYLGRYVFGGSQSSSAPFTLDTSTTPATVTYNGDGNVSYLSTPSGQKIQLNLPGDGVFTASGANVLGSLNQLIADFASGTSGAPDMTALSAALAQVAKQRVIIDNSITRVQSASSYAQNESAQLTAEQTTLLQADIAQISVRLSAAQSQQTALAQILANLGKGSLFDKL